MTDRLNGFIVVLENDTRDDDAEPILTALRMVKGVLSVSPLVAQPSDYIAQERVKSEMGKKLLAVIYPDMYGDKK